jgi:hypothetical protein
MLDGVGEAAAGPPQHAQLPVACLEHAERSRRRIHLGDLVAAPEGPHEREGTAVVDPLNRLRIADVDLAREQFLGFAVRGVDEPQPRLGVSFLAGSGEGDPSAVRRPDGLHHRGMAGGQAAVLPGGQVRDPQVAGMRMAALAGAGVGDVASVVRDVEGGDVERAARELAPAARDDVDAEQVLLPIERVAGAVLLVGKAPAHLDLERTRRSLGQARPRAGARRTVADRRADDGLPAAGHPAVIADAVVELAHLPGLAAAAGDAEQLPSARPARDEGHLAARGRIPRRRIAVAMGQLASAGSVARELPQVRHVAVLLPVDGPHLAHHLVQRGDAVEGRDLAVQMEIVGGEFGHRFDGGLDGQCLAEPGSAVLRCCSASMLSGTTLVIAALSLFFQPATTWSSPFFIAS